MAKFPMAKLPTAKFPGRNFLAPNRNYIYERDVVVDMYENLSVFASDLEKNEKLA